MKEGRQYSFWQLITSEAILIPQIQRDYVQYRGGKVEANLARFVSNLVNAISIPQPLNLNFVYGSKATIYETEESFPAFIPIDGQQRLTTLFLLHYYIFNEAEDIACESAKEKLKGRFYYRTRSTTQDFLNALLKENKKKFHNENILPSEIIKNSGWYSSLWNFDPSILSCLKVLDQIKSTFRCTNPSPDWTILSNRLIKENCPITFMKLEIEGIDKPNELYIKMNSRGKQLTAFENFKTELYGYINDNSESFSTSFKQNMDGEWLSFLWNLCADVDSKNDLISEKYTDVFYRELLHWIIVNRACCNKKSDEITEGFKKLFFTDAPESFYLSDYQNEFNNDDFISAIQDIYYTINLLCNLKGTIKESVTKILFDLRYEKEVFSSSVSQYMQRTLLFAITKYANAMRTEIDAFDEEAFAAWWRVIQNLVRNSQIDSIKTFFPAIEAINSFNNLENIVSYILGLDESSYSDKFIDLPALNPRQCREEILKQRIISCSTVQEWKKEIYSAESNSYFCGEILFALNLSGVNEATDATSDNLTVFRKNWENITSIFNDSRDDINIHRLLLVYGDYSEEASKYSDDDIIQSYYYNDTKHHNKDWRGLLRNEAHLKIFSTMLEEFKNSKQTFEKFSCSKIGSIKTINQVNCNPEKKELHYHLIKDPELFKYIQAYGRCWFWKDDIYLLRTSTRGCYVNLKLFVVYSALKSKGIKVKLHEGKGAKADDHLSINSTICYCNENGLSVEDEKGCKIENLSIEQAISLLNIST